MNKMISKNKARVNRRRVAAVLCFFMFALTSKPLLAEDEVMRGVFDSRQNTGYGPLFLRSASPFQFLRLSLLLESPDILEKGRFEIRQVVTWVNLWGFERDKYIVDGEILRSATCLKYGVTRRWQVGVELPVMSGMGGFADGYIEDFHQAFGMGQHHRDEFERNQFKVELRTKEGDVFSQENLDGDIGLQDTILSSTLLITRGSNLWPAVSSVLHIKLPTGGNRELLGSKGIDFGLSLVAAKRLSHAFHVYLGVGYVYFDSDRFNGTIRLTHDQWTFMIALEYRLGKRTSLVAQYLGNSGAARDLYEFSKSTHEITFGFQWQTGDNTQIQIGVLENIFFYDNSPDIGLHFGICFRF